VTYRTATPRPWTVDTTEGGGWAVVAGADKDGAKVIADLDDTYGDRAANAALIVAAVNLYDVETLARLLKERYGDASFGLAVGTLTLDRFRLDAEALLSGTEESTEPERRLWGDR
jgi:hypothetical protein